MYVFTMPAENFNENAPDKQSIFGLIKKHMNYAKELKKLKMYYEGKHCILSDSNRKTKLVCNHPKDIADTASSYFIGEPVKYKCEDADIKPLTDALESSGADETDGDNGLDLSIYGEAYEYIYAEEGNTTLSIKNLQPEQTFIVYDDTIEQNELFSVYYYRKKDDTDRQKDIFIATLFTRNYKYVLSIEDSEDVQILTELPEEHFMGEQPIVRYQNNKLCIGDYELQIPLVDAYNALMSDRITDKEQFIDAILALYGSLLMDEDDNTDSKEDEDTAMKRLKKERLLELPKDAKAEYLTRTFDENGVEILKKAIEQDIHKFSHIPCMTDESFGGNVSGVAMEFKLLGMENITKIKTRYYKKGLRKRLRIFAHYLKLRGITIDISCITESFTRAMPKNLLEISQYVGNLWGKVSRKTLLSQVPFVQDVDEELQAVDKESEAEFEKKKKLFGNQPNDPYYEIEDEDDEE